MRENMEYLSNEAMQVNMERGHARLVLPDTEGGGKEFAVLAALYYLNWYLLVSLVL